MQTSANAANTSDNHATFCSIIHMAIRSTPTHEIAGTEFAVSGHASPIVLHGDSPVFSQRYAGTSSMSAAAKDPAHAEKPMT